MRRNKIDHRILLSLISIGLLLVSAFVVIYKVEPVLAGTYLKLKWVANIGAQTNIGALAADLNGDGKLEIVVTGGTNVTALNGTDGSVIWTVAPGGIGSHSPFEIADVNNDRFPEIVVAAGTALVLHGINGSVYWRNTAAPADGHWPTVADIDGDGYFEIFVNSGNGPNQGYDYITSLTYDGKIMYQTICWHPCFGGLTIGDTNFDGRFELYQGDRSIYYNPPEDPYKYGGWGVRAIDAHTLTPLWNDSTVLCSSHCPILADVDKDGILDVIVADQGNDGVAVYWSANGKVVTTGGKYRKGSIGSPAHSQPTVYDVDGDGNLEIITCSGSNPVIWDLYEWKLDYTLPRSAGEPPKVGDVTGDGKMDIILSSGSSIYIYSYNNVTKSYDEVDYVTGLTGANAFTLLADVDNDGYMELIVTSSSTSGPVYCFDTPTPTPNPPPRTNYHFYSERKCGAAEYVPPVGPSTPALLDEKPRDGSTNQPLNPTLSVRVTDFQGDLMNVTFVTNATGTWQTIAEYINVKNGVYNATPINMDHYGTTYYWGVNASDSGSGSYRWMMFKFTTYTPASWWDNKWLYRKRIIIDHNKVAENLTNFPVLVDVTDADLASKAQDDGDDIAFTDYYGNKLDHEIEYFDGVTGRLTAWVEIPELSSTTDTLIYIYYGNPTASNQENPSGVWDSHFLAVHHLEETSGTVYDSTAYGKNGTPYGGLNQNVTGKINRAAYFDGVDDYIKLPQVFSTETQFTLEAWFYSEGTMPNPQYIVSQWSETYINGTPIDSGAHLNIFQNSTLQLLVNEARAGKTVSLGVWYYVVGTFDGSTATLYLNGGEPVSFTANLTWPLENMYLGDRSDHQRKFHGVIDEVRISDIPRSARWIKTCYNNQYDPTSFYTIYEEELVLEPEQAPIVSCIFPSDGEIGVPISVTELRFDLNDYQGDLMNYTVTTSPHIGSRSGINVGNGTYTVSVSGLKYGTTYTWHVNVTDGTHWTNETFEFTTRNPPEYWWDNRWLYRKSITIDHSNVAADLTDFPVLIDLTDADLASKAQDDGDDIAFADYFGYKLDHEIEYFDGSTGRLIAWVRIPYLSSTVDTTIYIYYGSPLSGQQDPSGVWDSHFLAVHHLEETSGTVYDSTGNNNHGTPYGNLNLNVDGKINGAAYFDGIDDDIELPQIFVGETQFTFEAWFYAEEKSPLYPAYIVSQYDGATSTGAMLNIYNNSGLQFYVDNNRTGKTVSLGVWYYVVGTFDGSTATLYLNGGEPVSFMASVTWPSVKAYIGNRADRQRHWKGVIDEVRVSDIPRSAGWIKTCYNNQYDPTSFYTIGIEEIGIAAEPPLVYDPSPANGETNVSIYLTEISFHIIDYQGDLMNCTVTTSPFIGSGSATNVGNGKYAIPVNYLSYSTTYTVYINVTDGVHWTYETFQFTTGPRPQYWWNNNWPYRKLITIDHTKVAADLIDFPVLIDLTDVDLASKAQDDGDDIAFTDYYGNKLDHEIEYFDGVTGRLTAWVEIPELSSTTDTLIYIYYGNPTASNQENPSGVWDSHFLAVHHLEETSGTVYDSTAYGKNGTPYGGLNQNVTGKINRAAYFDGVDDKILLSQVFSTETQFTMEAWIYAETGARYFVSQWNNNSGVFIQVGTDGKGIEWYINGVSAGGTGITLNTWYYVVGTYDGSTARLYLNAGTPVTKTSTPPNWPSEGTYISDRSAGQRQFHGIIDEVRFSNIARSAEWIKTCYNNQYNPSAFYTIGSEQLGPPSETLMFVTPANTSIGLGSECTVYIEIAYVSDLYAWEFQLDYDPTMLDITSVSVVSGGLNEPTYVYYNLTDEITGHLWWAVSTTHPTTTGITYDRHAIFTIQFRAVGVGTSNIGLYGTHLSDSSVNPILHSVVNGSITVTGAVDLTVTNIAILNYGCTIYANDTYVDGTDYYYPVEVTIYNSGTVDAGPFYVKLEIYWISDSQLERSAEIFVSSLAAGTSITVNFTELFHPTHVGYYRLIATVDSRSEVIEVDETNNVFILDNIPVGVTGDINGDGTVNILDAVIIALAWNSKTSDPQWDIKADLNHDGEINILDGTRIGLHWGQSW